MRRWTRANHNVLRHATVEAIRAKPADRYWKEHNFVLDRDGLFLHGARRDVSRFKHRRRTGHLTPEALLAQETRDLDIRFLAGAIGPSELRWNYKKADAVARQFTRFGLAEIEDFIDPVGRNMAGNAPAPWPTKAGRCQAAGRAGLDIRRQPVMGEGTWDRDAGSGYRGGQVSRAAYWAAARPRRHGG